MTAWIRVIVFMSISTFISCSSDFGGTAVSPPWSEQLRIMQDATASIEAGSVLLRGVASQISTASDGLNPLRSSFEFVTPSGKFIQLSFEDRRMQETLEVDTSTSQATTILPQEERDRLTHALATVRINATEALSPTLAEGKVFTEQHRGRMDFIVGLHLDKEIQASLGVPAAWLVIYFAPQKEFRVWVDAQTGEILKREYH